MASNAPLSLDSTKLDTTSRWLNPTKLYFSHRTQHDSDEPSGVQYLWSSRNNRKGRHTIALKEEDAASDSYDVPPFTNSVEAIALNIWRMLTYYPVWDISWLGAYVFTVGSLVWVINAFLVWQPWTQDPSEADTYYGGGATAFLGATIYEIGSVFLMLEAVNAKHSGCFGWALEQVMSSAGSRVIRALPSEKACGHHHANKRSFLEPATDLGDDVNEKAASQEWSWWPSEDVIKKNLLRDLGFWASSAQMVGATIFWISGYTALPGIYNNLSDAATIGAYWVPQIVGGSFFVLSGSLFMLEVQDVWWKPAMGTLGWHIGFWNAVGGVGFTLCPIFGLLSYDWALFQSSCSTFWGSWAFLIGSVVQWYESLSKFSVERRRDR